MCYSSGVALPSSTSDQALATNFVKFFHNKVKKIRDGLDSNVVQQNGLHPPPDTNPPSLPEFSQQSPDDIRKIINKCANKTCSLDVIPTSLLKEEEVLTVLLPTLTTLVNSSIVSGVFPDSLKRAQVSPLLKKNGLDVSNLNNYRPVSNVPFLGKVMEKVIAHQLNAHLTRNGLHDDMQSAYKQGTSTETALIRIKADVDMILNDGDSVLLVLLDLSAAFDTVDHNILLTRLQQEVGLQGTALRWIQSYLTNRTQAVHINSSKSSEVGLSVGVPQGSVLGPLLFLVYLLPLKRVIALHHILRHGFADDTQLYNRLMLRDASKCEQQVQSMQNCLAEVRSWMRANQLKLNDSKTEVMIITKKTQLKLAKHINIIIGEASITPKPVVGNLGARLDQVMSMEQQVSSVTPKMYFNIRRISKIKHHLSSDASAKVINATVTSHLDYHNGLLLGLSDTALYKLQVAQNNATRLLTD
jgi:hypothetical protein